MNLGKWQRITKIIKTIIDFVVYDDKTDDQKKAWDEYQDGKSKK